MENGHWNVNFNDQWALKSKCLWSMGTQMSILMINEHWTVNLNDQLTLNVIVNEQCALKGQCLWSPLWALTLILMINGHSNVNVNEQCEVKFTSIWQTNVSINDRWTLKSKC